MITRRAICTLPVMLGAGGTWAQTSADVILRAAEGTSDGRLAALAHQLRIANVNVQTVPGYGPVKNVASLLEQRDAEVAVLPADVLAYLRRLNRLPDAAGSLRYIALLYSAPVHILARKHITSITQLVGQKVGIGANESVSYVTAAQLFDVLALHVQPQSIEGTKAMQMLRRGELSALVHVGEAPAPLFLDVNRQQDDVQFLPVTLVPALSRIYPRAQLSIQDYPLLIGEGEAGSGTPVPTVAVPMLLAVYDWPAGSAARRRLSLFATVFSSNAPSASDVPGWVRFEPNFTAPPVARKPTNQPPPLTAGQREALFKEFEKWRQQQNQPPPLTAEQREALFKEFEKWRQQQ